MQLTMLPGSCSNAYQRTGNSFCESCFARAMVHGTEAELACIASIADDTAEISTLVMRYGQHEEAILLTPEKRELLAYGEWRGWESFVERFED